MIVLFQPLIHRYICKKFGLFNQTVNSENLQTKVFKFATQLKYGNIIGAYCVR